MKKLFLSLLLTLLCTALRAQFNPSDPAEPSGHYYKLTLTASPTDAGYLSGSGSYARGDTVDIYTYTYDDYQFVCWKEDTTVISVTQHTKYVMPDRNVTLTAVYCRAEINPDDPAEPNTGKGQSHLLTVIKTPSESGSVNYEGTVSLKQGESIYLYATTNGGYQVYGWYHKGVLKSVRTSYTYTMGTADDTVTVRFVYDPDEPREPGNYTEESYILITTQSELEQYAGQTIISTSVKLSGPDITSLDCLSGVTHINGDLWIENTGLTSLEGLESLKQISGDLVVTDNRMLTSLEGVQSLTDAAYVLIEDNNALESLCAISTYAGNSEQGNISGNAFNPTLSDIAKGDCSTGPVVNHLSSYEFWYDNNFNGRKRVWTADSILDITIDTDTLPMGLHTLNMRFGDIFGNWSAPVSQFFMHSATPDNGINEISAYEYWLDTGYSDRSTGNWSFGSRDRYIDSLYTDMPMSAASMDGFNGVLGMELSLSELPKGEHTLYFRARDRQGLWSSPIAHTFVKTQTSIQDSPFGYVIDGLTEDAVLTKGIVLHDGVLHIFGHEGYTVMVYSAVGIPIMEHTVSEQSCRLTGISEKVLIVSLQSPSGNVSSTIVGDAQ